MRIDKDDIEAALGLPVSSWEVEPIDPHLRIHSVTGGVFRIRTDVGSCVLKVVRRGVDEDPGALWVSGAEPAHRNYWKREWLAFASGLLDDLPGRLHAPRTIRAEERADECWIWMDEVSGRTGATLTLDDYRTIGYDLGTTQGSFASGATELPEGHDWLSRRWLRGWVGACAALLSHLDDPPEQVRPLRERVRALWERRDDLLRIVEAAPHTLVHCDFWPTNLLVDDTGTTYAIDWSQVGIGGLAQDLDQLTLDPVWMQVRPGGSIDELEQAVLPSYVAGLRASSCRVEEDDVRRWYAAAAGVHYSWMAGAIARMLRDDDEAARLQQRWGRPIEEITEDRLRVVRHAVELGERALGSTA